MKNSINFKYSDVVRQHFLEPQNAGELDLPDIHIRVGSLSCGILIQLQANMKEQCISSVRFKAYGCCCAIAAASLATIWLKGKTLEELQEIDAQYFISTLELPNVKRNVALMMEDAISTLAKTGLELKKN